MKKLASANNLHLQKIITLRSFKDDDPHREILVLSLVNTKIIEEEFIIYDEPKVYAEQYKTALKDFFTIFV